MADLQFVMGLAVALLAYVPVEEFQSWLRRRCRVPRHDQAVPVWITGTFERLLAFFLILLTDGQGAYAVLIAWMAAKLAANWPRWPLPKEDDEQLRKLRARTFIALMTGIVSLAFGVFGGLIANGTIKLP